MYTRTKHGSLIDETAPLDVMFDLSFTHSSRYLDGKADFSITVKGLMWGRIGDVNIMADTGHIHQQNSGFSLANSWLKWLLNPSVSQELHQVNAVQATGDVHFSLSIAGNMTGYIGSTDLSLVDAEISQSNSGIQLPFGMQGGASNQAIHQYNLVQAVGDLDFSLQFQGNMSGWIGHMDVALITGTITQTNLAAQIAVGQGGYGAGQSALQDILQSNIVSAAANLHCSLTFADDMSGRIGDIEVGLVNADILQSAFAAQKATNAGGHGPSPGQQTIEQMIEQYNAIQAAGDIYLSITFDHGMSGSIGHLDVGIISADILQGNWAVQSGTNTHVGHDLLDQLISQHAIQVNTVSTDGEQHIALEFTGNFNFSVSELEIGLVTSNVSQSNVATQVAVNFGGEWHLIA